VPNQPLTLALPKGRILEEALEILAPIGFGLADPDIGRKLVVPSQHPDLRYIVVRATDVPTYVAFGAADMGIVGLDTLIESGADLLEPLDLGIGKCHMAVATPAAIPFDVDATFVKVATKYPRITRAHYEGRGVQAEIIKLYGSMELAPLVGLADHIVDLVSTGATMRENGLKEVERIMAISSRLVVNRAAMRLKTNRIEPIIQALRAQIARRAA